MDGKRFDELTRAIAGSRRGLLRGAVVAAGAALGGVGLRRAEAACIKFNRPCGGSQTCCNNAVCLNGRCRCGPGTQVCAEIPGKQQCVVPCPPGQSLGSNCRCLCNTNGRPPINGSCGLLVNGESCDVAEECQSNFCNTDEGVCSDPCTLLGDDCETGDECCSGTCGGKGSVCIDEPECLGIGEFCSDPADCCAGGCNDFCCIPTGSACASDDCCGGSCYNGTCCNLADDGFSCGADTECCSGICNDYTGSCIATCIPDLSPCADSGDCCSGFCDFEFSSFGNCQGPG